jgi:hypothetical protein
MLRIAKANGRETQAHGGREVLMVRREVVGITIIRRWISARINGRIAILLIAGRTVGADAEAGIMAGIER